MVDVDDIIAGMSLDRKVGQLFTIGFCGASLTPEVIELVTRLHVGGLRLNPNCKHSFHKYEKVMTVEGTGEKKDAPPSPT